LSRCEPTYEELKLIAQILNIFVQVWLRAYL